MYIRCFNEGLAQGKKDCTEEILLLLKQLKRYDILPAIDGGWLEEQGHYNGDYIKSSDLETIIKQLESEL